MKLFPLAVVLTLCLAQLHTKADAPGYDGAALAHIVRAGQIHSTLMEAKKKGQFTIEYKRVVHTYAVTRPDTNSDTLCYRHTEWPGIADRCEFIAEMSSRFARDWAISVR